MLRVSGKVENELKDCVYYERILNVCASMEYLEV